MRNYFYLILTLLVTLSSCDGGKKSGDDAETLYDEAVACFENGNYNKSKILIDSINVAYRRNVEVRKLARALSLKIDSVEEARTRAYFDSIRPFREEEAASLKKHFKVTSDSIYNDYVKYTHRNQAADAPRISLIAEVKDDGTLQIVSVYMGRKLNHTKVKVVGKDDFYVETERIDPSSPYNNSFDDFGTRWEYLTFSDYMYGDLAKFIANNVDNKLKVVLIADSVETKKGMKADSYTYILDPRDKTAIKEALEFATILKDLKQMKSNY